MNTMLCRACPRGLFTDATCCACMLRFQDSRPLLARGRTLYCPVVQRDTNKFLRRRLNVVHCLIATSSSLLKSNRDQKEAGCSGKGLLYMRTRFGAAMRGSHSERNNVLGACAKEAKRKRASPTRARSDPDS